MSSLRSKFAYWFIDTFVPVVFPRLNPIARRLLKSRAHILVSWYVVVLCFEGRRTGRHYEVPVAYHRAADGVIEAVTSTRGRWWKNLRSDAEASVLIKGKERRARVEILVDNDEAITKILASRDRCRKMLMPISPSDTVVLRVHFRDGS
ncbi:MAG: hypothetical protein WD333_01075 [Dehalococcoidia bacterium]